MNEDNRVIYSGRRCQIVYEMRQLWENLRIKGDGCFNDNVVYQVRLNEYINGDEHNDQDIKEEILFAIAITKNSDNYSNHVNGYCSPRFKYTCKYCQQTPWMESRLINQHNCKTRHIGFI